MSTSKERLAKIVEVFRRRLEEENVHAPDALDYDLALAEVYQDFTSSEEEGVLLFCKDLEGLLSK